MYIVYNNYCYGISLMIFIFGSPTNEGTAKRKGTINTRLVCHFKNDPLLFLVCHFTLILVDQELLFSLQNQLVPISKWQLTHLLVPVM